MSYLVVLFLGIATGAFCMFVCVVNMIARSRERQREALAMEALAKSRQDSLTERDAELHRREGRIAEFEKKVIVYEDLVKENKLLKRDLHNIDLQTNKLMLDDELRGQKQEQLDRRSQELGSRYLNDTVKFIGASLTANNFSACKDRLLDVIRRCRDAGFDVNSDQEQRLVADLRADYQLAVRAAFEREEQARIKAQIREEERLKREIERELSQLERERLAIKAALDRAMAEAQDAHSEEVQRLEAKLAEAEEKSRRAISMAQQTKAGNVYVISNIGSFGRGVFKIGMTRRLEPNDRIRELCGASVPFPFDVHMMIACTDAPALESLLHREFHKTRINKANPRKEFFRADLESIARIVKANHGEIQYTVDAAALEYNQSQSMTDEDSDYIDSVYKAVAEDENDLVAEEP